jgi:hypothetical protein
MTEAAKVSGGVESVKDPPIATNIDDVLDQHSKIDPITALQDDIDGLSLAMFEAFRGLRDAVAPESGNLGGSQNRNETTPEQPDMDDLWHHYRSGDPDVTNLVAKACEGRSLPQKRDEFIRLHAKMEMEKDTELVMRLAGTVLEKSSEIDDQVDILPGMHRTKTEQMNRIEELIGANRKAIEDLEEAYASAERQRDACRSFVQKNSCAALGIIEDTE